MRTSVVRQTVEWKRRKGCKQAYTGCGDAGAPVCIRLYCDVGQSRAKQWTQQLPKAFNLEKKVWELFSHAVIKEKETQVQVISYV